MLSLFWCRDRNNFFSSVNLLVFLPKHTALVTEINVHLFILFTKHRTVERCQGIDDCIEKDYNTVVNCPD